MKSSNFIFEVDEEDPDDFEDREEQELDAADDGGDTDINDSGYTLKTGSKLYYPGFKHRIAVASLSTVTAEEGSDMLEYYTNDGSFMVLALNQPDLNTKYAQIAVLYPANFDSKTRKLTATEEAEAVYIKYTNIKNFVWNMNPNEAPENRLPVREEYANLNGTGTGGKYWQPFLSKVASSKKRDALKPSDFRSLSIRIDATNRQVADQILNDKAINFNTIKRIINGNKSNSQFSTYPNIKRQYLSELISKFTDESGSKPYPMILVNYGDYIEPGVTASKDSNTIDYKDAIKSDLLSQTGLERIQSLTVDFMEIIHPVALVNNSLNGNANKKILEFLGANSFQELQSGASIQFHGIGEGARTNTPLIDSIVYYRGRKIEISSKKAGGMGASLSNLADKLREVLTSDIGAELRRLVNSDERYRKSFKFLNSILESGRGEQYKVAFEMLSSEDLSVAERVREEMRATSANGQHLTPQELQTHGFSISVIQAYEKNKQNTVPAKYSKWQLLMNAVWTTVTDKLNSNPAFGNLVTWIFNHAAVIQVDTHTQEIKTKDGRAEVLTNIIGTWPSQVVETVKLSPTLGGENVKYSLLINGYKDQSFSVGDNDTSPLSDKDKAANTTPERPTGGDTYTTTQDTLGPGSRSLDIPDTRGYRTGIDIDTKNLKDSKSKSVLWQWAGSGYDSQTIKQWGGTPTTIKSILEYRSKIINLINKSKLLKPESFHLAEAAFDIVNPVTGEKRTFNRKNTAAEKEWRDQIDRDRKQKPQTVAVATSPEPQRPVVDRSSLTKQYFELTPEIIARTDMDTLDLMLSGSSNSREAIKTLYSIHTALDKGENLPISDSSMVSLAQAFKNLKELRLKDPAKWRELESDISRNINPGQGQMFESRILRGIRGR
jgi:hypothetical protein